MNDSLVCTFVLDGQSFGIAVEHVQEIIRSQKTTRVPLAPPAVRGLINLRGQIVAAIDLRRRLGLPERPGCEPPINVVVRTDDGAASLLVDDIGDVLPVSAAAFEPPPPTLAGPARELIRGAVKLESTLLLILDVERAVAVGSARPLDRPETPS